MESEGVPGSIQVTPATYELIKDAYECEPRGYIPVKGKSSMMTDLLISRRDPSGERRMIHERRSGEAERLSELDVTNLPTDGHETTQGG
jgi:hypothetical protein